jgi:hypothetical protein
MMRAVPAFTIPLALAATLLCAPTGRAAEPLKSSSFGTGKAAGPLLTRAELRDCMTLNERIRTRSEEAAREVALLEKERAELRQSGEDLKALLETLDRTSADAVEQYNARAGARDRAIDALEARANEYNARAETLVADRAAFAKRCENRRFDERDETAIRSGK